MAVQVKSLARGICPGAVRDFATAVAVLREQIGACTALMVSTVGRPTAEALDWAGRLGIVCLHYCDFDRWLAENVSQK